VTVSVTAWPTYTVPLDVEVCPGETYLYQGVAVAPGETREFHGTTQEGCDSTVVVTVTAYPEAAFSASGTTTCPQVPTGTVTITAQPGPSAPYGYSLDGLAFQSEPAFSGLGAGSYTVYLEDSHGCRFDTVVGIEATELLEVALADGVLPCDSAGIWLTPSVTGDTTGLAFLWSTGDTTRSLRLTGAGPVWVQVQNACQTVQREARVEWAALAADEALVYVPNTLAPDAAEIQNAVFRSFFPAGVTVVEYALEVYDRWGNLIHRTERVEEGWEGAFRRRTMDPAVFVWHLRARLEFCGRTIELKRHGDVTIVR
jgi:hypothetical protein